MKNKINELIEFLWLLWHTTPVVWKLARHRWFVFMDSPDYLVKYWATVSWDELENYPDLVELKIEAEKEYRVREVNAKFATWLNQVKNV